MSLRTTTPVQRVDMLLAQAERFAELEADEEAIARARQVIAYAELEGSRTDDPSLKEQLEMRGLIAESLIRRLGKDVRDRRGRVRVQAEDAAVPKAWD